LEAAADALRRADADAARRALLDLAARMTQDLAEPPGAGVQGLVAVVGEARRAMGLEELPAFAETSNGANVRESPAAPAAGSEVPVRPVQATGSVAEGQGTVAPAAGAEVKPEDRDVVRRYFGG
jgi:hypothetical protein